MYQKSVKKILSNVVHLINKNNFLLNFYLNEHMYKTHV